MTTALPAHGPAPNGAHTSRSRARVWWSLLWSALIWPLFVAVTVVTLTLWVVAADYTETTPVSDLSFFALGAMIGAGFASQVKRDPPAAGVAQAVLASMALFVSGLVGSRVEPMAGGALLTAAAVVAAILHPQPRGLLHLRLTHSRVEASLALLGAAAGISYAVMMLTAARGAGPSCFLGQCAHGDRLAEMAATALTIPALAALAAWRVDGGRLPLWSAGIGAVTLGATSTLLPSVSGSLGVLGGTAAIAWGVLLIERGEHARPRTRKTATR